MRVCIFIVTQCTHAFSKRVRKINNKNNRRILIMKRFDLNVMYIKYINKKFAYDQFQDCTTCYCIVDDDEHDIYEFNEMIENDDNICDCCDEMTIIYLSKISFEQQLFEYDESNLFECFTHVVVQEKDDDGNDELFVFDIEDYYYLLDCILNDIESKNQITSIKIMCPCCKQLYDSSSINDVA